MNSRPYPGPTPRRRATRPRGFSLFDRALVIGIALAAGALTIQLDSTGREDGRVQSMIGEVTAIRKSVERAYANTILSGPVSITPGVIASMGLLDPKYVVGAPAIAIINPWGNTVGVSAGAQGTAPGYSINFGALPYRACIQVLNAVTNDADLTALSFSANGNVVSSDAGLLITGATYTGTPVAVTPDIVNQACNGLVGTAGPTVEFSDIQRTTGRVVTSFTGALSAPLPSPYSGIQTVSPYGAAASPNHGGAATIGTPQLSVTQPDGSHLALNFSSLGMSAGEPAGVTTLGQNQATATGTTVITPPPGQSKINSLDIENINASATGDSSVQFGVSLYDGSSTQAFFEGGATYSASSSGTSSLVLAATNGGGPPNFANCTCQDVRVVFTETVSSGEVAQSAPTSATLNSFSFVAGTQ